MVEEKRNIEVVKKSMDFSKISGLGKESLDSSKLNLIKPKR